LAAGEFAKENKLQVVVHAMGEQAIDLIVDTFYGKYGWLKDRPSIRIEHRCFYNCILFCWLAKNNGVTEII